MILAGGAESKKRQDIRRTVFVEWLYKTYFSWGQVTLYQGIFCWFRFDSVGVDL